MSVSPTACEQHREGLPIVESAAAAGQRAAAVKYRLGALWSLLLSSNFSQKHTFQAPPPGAFSPFSKTYVSRPFSQGCLGLRKWH